MHVDAGRLNKRIQLIRRVSMADAEGYRDAGRSGEEVVRECWAQVSQTSGTELAKAGALWGEARWRFLVRAHPDLLDRRLFIRYDGADYDIQYLNTYGDGGQYAELWCERRTLEGRA